MVQKRRVLILSVRGLLLLVLALCLVFGLAVRNAHKQRAAVAAIEGCGGSIHYDWQFAGYEAGNTVDLKSQPPGPAWLRRLVGDEYFQEVTWVGLINESNAGESTPTSLGNEAVMSYLSDLPRLKWLQIWKGQASDAGLANLRDSVELEQLHMTLPEGLTAMGLSYLDRLPKLINLQIRYGEVDDSCLAPIGKLSGLIGLSLNYLPITDSGIAQLRGLNHLEHLSIIPNARGVTDEGLKCLAGMTKLRTLNISGVPATDLGLTALEPLPLRSLTLAEDAPRPEGGIRRLTQARPKLSVSFLAMPPLARPN